MFTGLIEELGRVVRRTRRGPDDRWTFETALPLHEVKLGDSIAVNGVCLTVVNVTRTTFCVDASTETLRASALGTLGVGDQVHLERAMRVDGRLDGHLVQGHVDAVGTIAGIAMTGRAWTIDLAFEARLRPLVVPKGSIAVDGVSLTVGEVSALGCNLTVVPFTGEKTLLATYRVGRSVNIETDMITRSLWHMLEHLNQRDEGSPQGDRLQHLLERFGFTT